MAGMIAAVLAAAILNHAALAQSRGEQGEVRGLRLGLEARTMSTDRFGEFACGSNGGPPRQRLLDWSEFGKCRPEELGLHEVYVRFDDFDEYVGKATDNPVTLGRTGTRVAGHPVILSALFDSGGVLRGLRFVSDPRGDPGARRVAHLLRLAVINRYDPARLELHGFPGGAGRNAGRRHLSQAALRKDQRGAPPDGGGALPAQARPERHRPGHRRIHHGPVRELDAVRDFRSGLQEAVNCNRSPD